MNEAAVQGRVGVGAQHDDVFSILFLSYQRNAFRNGGTGQVADWAGNDGDFMTTLCQTARQFVVAGASWFVQGGKCLVDEQDVHIADDLRVCHSKELVLGGRSQWVAKSIGSVDSISKDMESAGSLIP